MGSTIGLFLSNILVFGMGTILVKAIGFLGLPILTRLIRDPEIFGVFDLLMTIGAFGAAFANFGINEGAFKVYFETDRTDDRRKILSTSLSLGIALSIGGGLLVFLGFYLAGGWFTGMFFNVPMALLAALLTVFLRSRNLFEIPLMIHNSRRVIVWVSLVEATLFYGTLIVVVAVLGEKWVGPFSMPIIRTSTLGLAIVLFFHYGRHFVGPVTYDRSVARKVTKTGLPLSFSSVFYWILSLMDRIFVSALLGNTSLGVYSVGAKVASLSELVRAAFTKGFPYFIYSTGGETGHKRRVMELVDFTVVLCIVSFVTAHVSSKTLFRVFLAPEFFESEQVFSYLLLSPLIFIAYQIVCADAIIGDRPFNVTIAQIAGCVVNVLLNVILVRGIGIVGGALATLSGFATMFVCIFTLQYRWMEDRFTRMILLSSLVLSALIALSILKHRLAGPLMVFLGAGYAALWLAMRWKRIFHLLKALASPGSPKPDNG